MKVKQLKWKNVYGNDQRLVGHNCEIGNFYFYISKPDVKYINQTPRFRLDVQSHGITLIVQYFQFLQDAEQCAQKFIENILYDICDMDYEEDDEKVTGTDVRRLWWLYYINGNVRKTEMAFTYDEIIKHFGKYLNGVSPSEEVPKNWKSIK